MFEIGAQYRVYTGQGDGLGSSVFEVVSFNAPLLQLRSPVGVTIINTSSPEFAKAEKVLTPEEEATYLQGIPDYLQPRPAPL